MKNPLSLDGLISWLEKQPADGTYNYGSIHSCLLCQYLTAIGLPVYTVGGAYWRSHEDDQEHQLPKSMDVVAVHGPWTFGAALERARFLQEHPLA